MNTDSTVTLMNKASPRSRLKAFALRPSRNAKKGDCHSTRAILLEAAKDVFAKLGFEATTFNAISEKAGVSGSQINYYFQDKIQLYRTILENAGSSRKLDYMRNLLGTASSETEFRLKLELFISELLAFYANDCATIRILIFEIVRGLPFGKDILKAKLGNIWNDLVRFFESASQAGFIQKEIEPKVVALSLIGMVHSVGAARLLNLSFDEVSLKDESQRISLAQKLAGFLIAGLKRPETGGMDEKPA